MLTVDLYNIIIYIIFRTLPIISYVVYFLPFSLPTVFIVFVRIRITLQVPTSFNTDLKFQTVVSYHF